MIQVTQHSEAKKAEGIKRAYHPRRSHGLGTWDLISSLIYPFSVRWCLENHPTLPFPDLSKFGLGFSIFTEAFSLVLLPLSPLLLFFPFSQLINLQEEILKDSFFFLI